MPVEIKRIAYGYNSALEDLGGDGYFLDCLVTRDGQTLVDRHESFNSAKAIFEAIEDLVPMLEPPNEDKLDESR